MRQLAYKRDHGTYETRDTLKTIRSCDLRIIKLPAHSEVLESQEFDIFMIGFVTLSSISIIKKSNPNTIATGVGEWR